MATTTKATGIFGNITKWLDALNYSSADYQIERSQWVTAKITDLEQRIEQLENRRPDGKIAA